VTVTKRDDAFIIDQLSMKNGDRELALYGRFAVVGNQDLTLTIDRLPLGLVTAFLAQPPKVTGLLAAHARVTGSADAPQIAASAKLTKRRLPDKPTPGDCRPGLSRQARDSATGGAPGRCSCAQCQRHAAAQLGLEQRLSSRFCRRFGCPNTKRRLSVAFLNGFSGKSLENIAGEVSLDASARGAVTQPELRGTFQLRDGRVKVVPLGVDINGITVTGGLDSRSVNVRELTAKAKDGEIKGSGSLALKDFDAKGFKLR